MHYYEIIVLETIGWIGSILYISAYFLLSNKTIEQGSLYYLLNIIAAIFVLVVSVYKNTIQPVFLNLFWAYFSYIAYKKIKFRFNFIHVKIFNLCIVFLLIFSLASILISKYHLALDILAWTSVFTFVVSYYLYSMHKIELHQFNIYNLIAPLVIIPKMYVFENYQVVVLEIIWAILALKAIQGKQREKKGKI